MYLWDMEKLVIELKTEQVPRWKTFLFIIITPIIHLSNLILFTTLLLGHQLLEYSFQDHLNEQDMYTVFYNEWAGAIGIMTLLMTLIGILICYRTNNKGDGKYFLQRLSILGFSVNFHITIYGLIGFGLLTLGGYLGVMKHIDMFKETIWPDDAAIKLATTHRELMSSMFRTTGSVIFPPLIPGKINEFLTTLRATLLFTYPVISLFPPILTLVHYKIVNRLLRKTATPIDRCPLD